MTQKRQVLQKTCRSARQNPCAASKKSSRFCVIARPHRGRGNLKVEGMASRGEAREHEAREHEAREHEAREHEAREHEAREHEAREHEAREHEAREYEAREYEAREYEAREHEAKRNPYHKKHGNRCVVPRPLSSFQGSVSFRSTIVRSGMTNRIVKDCRVGRKECALLAMTNLVGFAGKRNGFQNEKLQILAERYHAKNNRKKYKTSVFQIKTPQFRVIARPQRGRGNL